MNRDLATERTRRKTRSARPAQRRKQRVLRTYGNTCHLCGNPIDLTLHHHDPLSYQTDHIIPVDVGLAQGMTAAQLNSIDNLLPSHRQCNRRRGTRPVDVARAELRQATPSRRW
jgi:hypothetical protein